MQQMINMLVLSPILDGLLSEVTEQQMEREGGKLPSPEKGEKLLGKINSVEAKRLYCAAKMAGAKAVRLRADAECAPDDNAEKGLRSDAEQTKMLSEILGRLAWFEAHYDMASWGKNVSIRAGWDLYEQPEDEGGGLPASLKKLLGLGE